MKIPFASIALGAVVGLAAAVPASAGGLDVDLYARLLERHTRAVEDIAGTRVDYAAIARSPDWKRLVEGLADAEPSVLGSREEKLAFWIDVYNILAIDVVRQGYPVDSIRDLGSFLRPVWKRPAGDVGGETVTLDQVEHDILRPMGEPRIHGAIVCASLSCPPLAAEPYRAAALDAQLDANVRRWLADPRKGVRADEATDTLQLSSIFKWFEEDFAAAGGVLAFVERYAPEDASRWIAAHRATLRIRYLDYDWSLNDLKR